MSSIKARRGETVLELAGSRLLVTIRGEVLGPYSVTEGDSAAAWRVVEGLSIPLSVGRGSLGVGGSSEAVEVTAGMTSASAAWWMTPPPGWERLTDVFDAVTALVPREVRSRYDFAAGGE